MGSVSVSAFPASLLNLDPATYTPHPLHGEDRAYPETNCWTDVAIELLHARGLQPLAALGSTVRIDFEGDQWTFFKTPPSDLELLYGIDVHEIQPYRPLPDQLHEQLLRDRTLLIEIDGWFLPDTAGTSYRSAHVKTSIAVEAIDRAGERLRYFHNTGYHELQGEDYRGAFRTDASAFAADVLPPYVELVRFDAGPALAGEELRTAAGGLLDHHLARRPRVNPFVAFGEQLSADLPVLLQRDATHFHDYAFATVRMAGSSFELLGSHATWLFGDAGASTAEATARIVEDCKLLLFKLARRRAFDPAPVVQRLATAWDDAMARLEDVGA